MPRCWSARPPLVRPAGKTLLDAIEALYKEFGYYRNALCSFAFEGEAVCIRCRT